MGCRAESITSFRMNQYCACTVQVELSSQNIGLALDVGKADNEKLKLHQMIATTDLCSTFPRNLP